MRNCVHGTRQGWAEQTDGKEEVHKRLEQTDGIEEVHKRLEQTDGIGRLEQNDRRQGREEQTDGIEEFQKLLEEENRKRGRHQDIRQGYFGPSDDERHVFPFVHQYTNKLWGPAKFVIPIDPVTKEPFDYEHTSKFFAWKAKLKK